jgi:hypothetical protein
MGVPVTARFQLSRGKLKQKGGDALRLRVRSPNPLDGQPSNLHSENYSWCMLTSLDDHPKSQLTIKH